VKFTSYLLKLLVSYLVIGIFTCSLLFAADELSHKGRSVQLWLGDLLHDDSRTRESAKRELEAMGTNALPAMLHYVAQDDPWDSSCNTSIVFNSFLILGQKAKPAIPKLRELANDTNYCSNAATALQLIGVDGALPLASVLTNQIPLVRVTILQRLGHYSSNSNAVVVLQRAMPAIEECVRAKDQAVSAEAMSTLTALCVDPTLVVRAITPNLRADSAHLRRVAAGSLRLYGAHAKVALPDLIKALADKDESMRGMAARAIREIDPEQAKKIGLKFPVYE
jgi:HEAT repeat protein